MSNKYILAIDQGTTSSRAIVFDHQGNTVSVAQKEFKQYYPQAGWVEHDPMEIWSSQSSVVNESISRANLGSDDIAAVGITNQRETTVVWNRKTGHPIHPAIVWQDRRTARRCREMKEAGKESIFTEKTGLRLDPYFSGTKVSWILENCDNARALAESGDLLFGTIDSWLIWKLTNGEVHVTDVTNASRTLMFNIHEQAWDEELLEMLGVPETMLPEVKSCSEIYGHIGDNHFPKGVPIAGIAGDQQAALFGQACFEEGMAKNTYGTGCFLLMNTGEKAILSENNLLTTVAWKIDGKVEYALEGAVFMAGAVVQWLRDELKMISSAQECDKLASEVADANGLFLVPAFAGLGAPHWDPYARGACLGMTRGTNRAHFCRAALESIAFQCGDLIRCMEKDSGLPLKQLRVDGGASRSEPMMQFQADLLQSEVVRPECIETTALGAAYLAGLAVGYWKDRQDITNNWKVASRFNPKREPKEMEILQKKWEKAVQRSMSWETED